jgi:hypothetical protein
MPHQDDNGKLCWDFYHSIKSNNLGHIAGWTKKITRKRAWEFFYTSGLRCGFKSFRDYLQGSPAWGGCGFDNLTEIKALIDKTSDPDAIAWFDEALAGKHGGEREGAGRPAHGEIKSDNVTLEKYDVEETGFKPQRGNSKSYTLRKLRDEYPDVFAKVKAGELSANAAAIEAGFRKPPPTPFEGLLKNWNSATSEDRARFLATVGAQPVSASASGNGA